MKKCCKCKVEKYLIEFSKNKSAKDGLSYECKECKKQYRITNTEHISESKKQWRKDNAEHIRLYDKQRYIDNIEYFKQHYLDNIEHYKQSAKQYAQTERGKLVYKTINHKRRILLNTNTPTGKHFTADDIILKLKLQHGKCVYCETSIKKYYEIDHIIPVIKGGSNEAWNIQLLCRKCNGKGGKGAKDAIDYAHLHGKLF